MNYWIETIDGRKRVIWMNFNGFPLTVPTGWYWGEPGNLEELYARGPFPTSQVAEDEAMNVDLCIARKEQT